MWFKLKSSLSNFSTAFLLSIWFYFDNCPIMWMFLSIFSRSMFYGISFLKLRAFTFFIVSIIESWFFCELFMPVWSPNKYSSMPNELVRSVVPPIFIMKWLWFFVRVCVNYESFRVFWFSFALAISSFMQKISLVTALLSETSPFFLCGFLLVSCEDLLSNFEWPN